VAKPKSNAEAEKARELIKDVNALEGLAQKHQLRTTSIPVGLPPEVQALVDRIGANALALGIAIEKKVTRHYKPPWSEDLPNPPGVVGPRLQLLHAGEESTEVVGPQMSWFQELLALRAKAEVVLGNSGAVPSSLDPDTPVSARRLADAHGVDQESLRKRLERYRRNHDSCYVEVEDGNPREPRFLYKPGAVQPVIDAMKRKASGETSSERPPRK